MRKLLLALLVVAVMAMPAFASVQNIKVSGGIESGYAYRENFELGLNSSAGEDEIQNLFYTITTIGIDADLTDNVSATIQLLNERAWNAPSTDDAEVDVNLAYVTLREMLYSPLTVVIGRQGLKWGNGFIIASNGSSDSHLNGAANDLDKGSAFDAIKMVLDYNPLTIEGIFSRITDSTLGLTGEKEDVNLYGINATYEIGDDMDSVVEAYIVKQVDHTTEDSDGDEILVKGIRGSINPLEGLNLQAEIALQSGTYVSAANTHATRKAKAVQLISNYKIPALDDYNPVVKYTFSYFSGDENSSSTSSDYSAWASMYEDQYAGKIFDALFDESNLIIHLLELSANPMEDVSATLSYAKLYTADGDASTMSVGSDTRNVNTGTHNLGQEIDVDVAYDYTEDVQILGTLGFFKPGDVFNYDDRTPAKQVMVRVNVGF